MDGARFVEELSQGQMIGPVHRLDTASGLGEGELAVVDLAPLGHQAGDGAEARGHPRGACAGEVWQVVLEHRRVELIGLAVHIDVGARVAGEQQAAAVPRGGLDQLVDQGVLGAAHRHLAQPRGGAHVGGIEAARVGRGEHQGRGWRAIGPLCAPQLERRLHRHRDGGGGQFPSIHR